MTAQDGRGAIGGAGLVSSGQEAAETRTEPLQVSEFIGRQLLAHLASERVA